MWGIVEESNPGFRHEDPATWSAYRAAGKYGLSMRGPCFHPEIVINRANTKFLRALKIIIGSDDIMVSHDRFTIYRATGSEIPNGDEYRTGCRNVHLDLNPWWWCESSREVLDGLPHLKYEDKHDFIKENNLVVKSMGRHVQCVLNFEDNRDDDGGTVLVPGFHRCIQSWCEPKLDLLPSDVPDIDGAATVTPPPLIGRFSDFVPRHPIPWLNLPASNPLLPFAQRIPMRAGSVLIWDQTVVHGSSPNTGTGQCRMAQFVKAFPAACIESTRLALRSQAVVRNLVDNGVDIGGLTDEAKKAFGIDVFR
jgi:ectoine hydroxylase-related dioxygenase (phytanoyl-CoA dioxygenase family)